ncbi:MAG: hypothetical protein GX605_00350, partial [Chloroflexi bacterium]|nr:hypothetical protein [Chloroflexota bacterium]
MLKRYTVTINGRSYLVEVEDLTASPAIVRVDGEEFEVGWQAEQPQGQDAPAASADAPAAPAAAAETSAG